MSYYSLKAKQCPDCGVTKPLDAFSKNAARPDGLQFYCKQCYSRRSARTYRERRARRGHKVRERVVVPAGHKYCPGCQQILPHREWHKNATTNDGLAAYCKGCRKRQGEAGHLKRTFGITIEERDALYAEQGGLCAICRSKPIKHIDHQHDTGDIRGGLCSGCNMGLGQFGDDPDRLIAAAHYLRRHERKTSPVAAVVDLGYWTRQSPLEASVRLHLAS